MNLRNQTMTSNDLPSQLRRIGLRAAADGLDDLIARATKQKWSLHQVLEEIARTEMEHKVARNLERRLKAARLVHRPRERVRNI